MTNTRKVIFYAVPIFAALLLSELGARAFFAFKVGPSILLYGTPFHHKNVGTRTQPSISTPPTQAEVKAYKKSYGPRHMAATAERQQRGI